MRDLREDFDVLAIDGETSFTYETVHYDTESLLAYRQHAQGRRRRFKIRCRRYVDSDLYFFEVKLKGSRGRTVKQRMLYDGARHGQDTLDAAASAFVGRCVTPSPMRWSEGWPVPPSRSEGRACWWAGASARSCCSSSSPP